MNCAERFYWYIIYLFCQKEEIEEEDGDSIEKVLWHQPKGMAEEALRNNRSTEPLLLSHLLDTEQDWNEMEFLIKWKGQSHLHCQWKSFSELQNVSFYFCYAHINLLGEISGHCKILCFIKHYPKESKLNPLVIPLRVIVDFPSIFCLWWLDLQLSGFKKVVNYTKKVMEDVKYRRTVSREEVISFIYYY